MQNPTATPSPLRRLRPRTVAVVELVDLLEAGAHQEREELLVVHAVRGAVAAIMRCVYASGGRSERSVISPKVYLLANNLPSR